MNPPTELMWQMVSDLLDGEKLPQTINEALTGLCDGTLTVVETVPEKKAIDATITET